MPYPPADSMPAPSRPVHLPLCAPGCCHPEAALFAAEGSHPSRLGPKFNIPLRHSEQSEESLLSPTSLRTMAHGVVILRPRCLRPKDLTRRVLAEVQRTSLSPSNAGNPTRLIPQSSPSTHEHTPGNSRFACPAAPTLPEKPPPPDQRVESPSDPAPPPDLAVRLPEPLAADQAPPPAAGRSVETRSPHHSQSVGFSTYLFAFPGAKPIFFPPPSNRFTIAKRVPKTSH
jgi:hypothetical protein